MSVPVASDLSPILKRVIEKAPVEAAVPLDGKPGLSSLDAELYGSGPNPAKLTEAEFFNNYVGLRFRAQLRENTANEETVHDGMLRVMSGSDLVHAQAYYRSFVQRFPESQVRAAKAIANRVAESSSTSIGSGDLKFADDLVGVLKEGGATELAVELATKIARRASEKIPRREPYRILPNVTELAAGVPAHAVRTAISRLQSEMSPEALDIAAKLALDLGDPWPEEVVRSIEFNESLRSTKIVTDQGTRWEKVAFFKKRLEAMWESWTKEDKALFLRKNWNGIELRMSDGFKGTSTILGAGVFSEQERPSGRQILSGDLDEQALDESFHKMMASFPSDPLADAPWNWLNNFMEDFTSGPLKDAHWYRPNFKIDVHHPRWSLKER